MSDESSDRSRRPGEPDKKTCTKCMCLKPIEVYGWWRGHVGKRKKECDPCSNMTLFRRARFRGSKPAALNTRKCHDCGAATTDYRCPVCLRQWQIKHHVPEDACSRHQCETAAVCLPGNW
jgi:hypothetical protein